MSKGMGLLCTLVLSLAAGSVRAGEIRGSYLESRSCQVYTGPCFANAEVGLMGKDAILAWNISEGRHGDVDLSGLSVVVVVSATDTLASGGINDPKEVKSVILVDDKADAVQRDALVAFAKERTGRAGSAVVRVDAAPISMSLDLETLTGKLAAGNAVKLTTRKAKPTDCICANEIAFYPPLSELENFVPGVSIESEFNGKGLGGKWSNPNTRSAYMGLFTF